MESSNQLMYTNWLFVYDIIHMVSVGVYSFQLHHDFLVEKNCSQKKRKQNKKERKEKKRKTVFLV